MSEKSPKVQQVRNFWRTLEGHLHTKKEKRRESESTGVKSKAKGFATYAKSIYKKRTNSNAHDIKSNDFFKKPDTLDLDEIPESPEDFREYVIVLMQEFKRNKAEQDQKIRSLETQLKETTKTLTQRIGQLEFDLGQVWGDPPPVSVSAEETEAEDPNSSVLTTPQLCARCSQTPHRWCHVCDSTLCEHCFDLLHVKKWSHHRFTVLPVFHKALIHEVDSEGLPQSLWYEVFAELSKADINAALRVCQSWFQMIHDSPEEIAAWSSLTISNAMTEEEIVRLLHQKRYTYVKSFTFEYDADLSDNDPLSDVVLAALGDSCRELRTLRLTASPDVTDDGVTALVQRAGHLKEISITGAALTDWAVEEIAANCLTLRWLRVEGDGVSDYSAECLRNCSQLEGLALVDAQISDEGVEIIAENCPKLRSVSLAGCGNVTSHSVTVLATHCELIDLDLDFCLSFSTGDGTADRAVEVASKAGTLQTLRLGGLSISDAALAAMTVNRNLRVLNLNCCSQVTDRGVESLARGCGKLIDLTLRLCGITDEALGFLAEGCRELRVLSVASCRVTDAGLRLLAGERDSSRGCHQLEALNLDFTGVTEEGVRKIFSECLQLRNLSAEMTSAAELSLNAEETFDL